MAISVDIRVFAKSVATSGDKALSIARVGFTIGGCLVVTMADGAEYDMGILATPSTYKVAYATTPPIVNTPSLDEDIGIDDIRVFSTLYLVQGNDDIAVTGITPDDNGVSITLDNGDTIAVGEGESGELPTPPMGVTPPLSMPPIFCNSFASVLKILSNVEIKDLEERIEKIEANTGSADISALKEQVDTNTTNIATLVNADAALSNRIANTEGRLIVVEEEQTAQGNLIVTMNTKVTSLTSRVTKIEKKVMVAVINGEAAAEGNLIVEEASEGNIIVS